MVCCYVFCRQRIQKKFSNPEHIGGGGFKEIELLELDEEDDIFNADHEDESSEHEIILPEEDG